MYFQLMANLGSSREKGVIRAGKGEKGIGMSGIEEEIKGWGTDYKR